MEVITKFEIHCGYDIELALKQLDQAFYVAPQAKFASDHVFDENKSVKWNREEAIRHNQENKTAFLSAREMKAKSQDYLEEEIYRYIMDESAYGIHFTRAEAQVIWQCTKNHHSSDPWNWVDEMVETIRDFIAVREVCNAQRT